MERPVRSASMRRMQWAALILCAAAIAINYLDRSTIAIANPEVRKEFNLSAAEFGALQSVWSLAFAITQLPVGLLIDRVGAGMLLGVEKARQLGLVETAAFARNLTHRPARGVRLLGDRGGGVIADSRREEDALRAKPMGGDGRHGTVDAELASFVGCGADDTTALDTADDQGLAAQAGLIALLDGRIESVHVHVHDFAVRHAATILVAQV